MCWSGHPGTPGTPGILGFSPCCGKEVKYVYSEIKSGVQRTNFFVCECGEECEFKDLIELEVFKNKKRTKLIERMLE